MSCYGVRHAKRTRHEIIIDVLNVTMKGTLIAHVVYNARLNSKRAKKYLDQLVERELVECEDRLYTTTSKGKDFIDNEAVYERYPWFIDLSNKTIYNIFIQLALGEEKKIDPIDYFNAVVKLHAARFSVAQEQAEQSVVGNLDCYARHYNEFDQIQKYWLTRIPLYRDG